MTFLVARERDSRATRTGSQFHERGTGTMKTLMAVLMLGGVLSMLSASVVWAGPFDGATFSVQDRGFGGARDRSGGHDRRQVREARSSQPPPQPPRERARGQMTEEERRQLHRDLDKANRELYGGNRR
jgi:hypothetical protein